MSKFSPHRQGIKDNMTLRGYSERTRDAYVREIEKVSDHFQTAPDLLTEKQVHEYLLGLRSNPRLGPSSVRMALHAIRFYLRDIMAHDYGALPNIRIPRDTRLPNVLTTYQVRDIIEGEHTARHRAFFWTVYSLGLRLSEAINLQTAHVDSARGLVHVYCGKGARDRYVPLPSRTLRILREHWRTHRHPRFLFPRVPRKASERSTVDVPISRSTVQIAFQVAVKRARISKRASLHTLRHSYATHLHEAGVSLTLIQQYLGHRSLHATMLYLHLTTRGHEHALDTLEDLMR